MNLSPLHEITNVGVLFGGQASAWQPNLAGYHADSYAKAQLDKLLMQRSSGSPHVQGKCPRLFQAAWHGCAN